MVWQEERAQAEAVFRIMIDSVIGLAILVIIISALGYFQDLTFQQSHADLISMVRSSSESPDGTIVGPRELSFSKGFGVSTLDAQAWTQKSANCFSLQSGVSSAVLSGSDHVEFTEDIRLKVFAQCSPKPYCEPTDKEDCCLACVISFGKKIE